MILYHYPFYRVHNKLLIFYEISDFLYIDLTHIYCYLVNLDHRWMTNCMYQKTCVFGVALVHRRSRCAPTALVKEGIAVTCCARELLKNCFRFVYWYLCIPILVSFRLQNEAQCTRRSFLLAIVPFLGSFVHNWKPVLLT